MLRENDRHLEISFDSRQLQVRDLTYALNNLTSAFHHGLEIFNEQMNATINRNEYVLRLMDIIFRKKISIKCEVAATRSAVELAGPETVKRLRSELLNYMFNELCDDSEGTYSATFRNAILNKAPRIENFTIRLMENLPDGSEKIIQHKKWESSAS